jgi:hypothetical protein
MPGDKGRKTDCAVRGVKETESLQDNEKSEASDVSDLRVCFWFFNWKAKIEGCGFHSPPPISAVGCSLTTWKK